MRKKAITTQKEGTDKVLQRLDEITDLLRTTIEILSRFSDFLLEVTVNDANEKIEELSNDDSN